LFERSELIEPPGEKKKREDASEVAWSVNGTVGANPSGLFIKCCEAAVWSGGTQKVYVFGSEGKGRSIFER
jgi:hypothetical protein